MPLSTTQLLAIIIELALMLVLPVVAAIWWCRRRRVPGSAPLIAAGCYLLNLVVNVPLVTLLYPRLGLPPLAGLALTALTYGVCEELARWLSFRIGSLRRHRDGDGAIAAGIGHGGTEAIMFGLPYLIGTLSLLLAPSLLPPETVSQLSAADPWAFIGTGLDRLPAMAGHLVFALLVVLAYRRGTRYLLLAMGAHAALDFTMFALRDYAPLPLFIATWAAVGLAALLLAVRLWRRTAA
ncbi:YhfC family intramembrane metalloprotease [Micropruina sonneratiae]|uniref:YhfC family intramembrane metalloprotease n=1 Tax=Micropruina sonneratiae TaxID=2986940 RepID=UPI002225F03F|nr:YhfC family intramembrane metalloprotease [Micropruina sp. KQZ13P-5]MCW3157250.1 YhfC family intramembrane metalloprotease [Micropruina sp. KQZ13P-5]